MRTTDATTATKEDSGLIDLKALSQSDVTANARGSAPPSVPAPLASAGLFDEDAPASRAAAPVPQAPVSQVPMARASAPSVVPAAVHSAPSMPVPARDQVASKDADSEKKGGALFLFGGVATIAAIAAGVFFVVRSSHPKEPAPIAVVQQTPAIAAPAAAPAEAPKAVAQADKPSGAVDPMSLPEATPDKAPPAAAAKGGGAIAKAPAAAAKAAPAKPETKEPEAKPAVDTKLVAKDLPQSPATTGSLGDAMKQAAGPSTDSPSAAATNPGAVIQPGSVSQKPSQGAVTGALGAALPSARACLGPDDPVSRAEIVFDSSGSVKSVNVTGAAAGKPAEACIKAALGKAKVPPFAEATYSARVTVRPN